MDEDVQFAVKRTLWAAVMKLRPLVSSPDHLGYHSCCTSPNREWLSCRRDDNSALRDASESNDILGVCCLKLIQATLINVRDWARGNGFEKADQFLALLAPIF